MVNLLLKSLCDHDLKNLLPHVKKFDEQIILEFLNLKHVDQSVKKHMLLSGIKLFIMMNNFFIILDDIAIENNIMIDIYYLSLH